jgi:phosphate transport system protein
MPRDNLNLHIQEIKDELLVMGSLVESATQKSIQALKTRDRAAAREIYLADRVINEKRYAVENDVLVLIATQQPLAHDLRLLAAMLEIASEMERMGDYAKGICKVNLNLEDSEIPIPINEFELMGNYTIEMLHKALTAFVNEDAETARGIPKMDDRVDKLFRVVEHFIIDIMVSTPQIIDHANLLMWVAHNLERMADRVTNICERTIFVATGELAELEVKPKDLTKDK